MRAFLVLLGIVLGLALGAGWYFNFGPSRTVTVETVKPTRAMVVEAVYATGTVEPTIMMPIAPRLSGRLVELLADEGHNVTKGQVLARLEDDDLKKSLDELRAREEYALKDFERKSALAKSGYEKKGSVDLAKSELDAIRAGISRTEVEAGYMQLMAPADGKIIRRDGEVGQMLTLNEPVFWMSCCAPLRISAEVDEEDISRVIPGQKVLIRADAFPGRTFDGAVQAITPKGDPVSRSYRVRITLGDDIPFHIGMTAESNIVISEKENALMIPSSALDQKKVWVVVDGKLQSKAVETGIRGADKVEILSGLTEADDVISKPEKEFTDGQSVRLRGEK